MKLTELICWLLSVKLTPLKVVVSLNNTSLSSISPLEISVPNFPSTEDEDKLNPLISLLITESETFGKKS